MSSSLNECMTFILIWPARCTDQIGLTVSTGKPISWIIVIVIVSVDHDMSGFVWPIIGSSLVHCVESVTLLESAGQTFIKKAHQSSNTPSFIVLMSTMAISAGCAVKDGRPK